MRDSRQPISFHIPGGSMLMTIFAVLCLTLFAVLALQTALAGQRIRQDAHAAEQAYYEADARANRLLAALRRGEACEDALLLEDGVLQYTVPMDHDRVLTVQVVIRDGSYRILSWQQGSLTPWTPEESISVWSGTEE